MIPEELKARTKKMSLDVLKIVSAVPHTREGDVIARQIIRSATSVAANYRAACRGRSHADFVNKLGIVEEEADETALWLEYIRDLALVDRHVVENELREVNELVSIFAASAIAPKKHHPEQVQDSNRKLASGNRK